jgi:alkanesulfonate monooxygenase SsuD/methylene tetrahydromethanopterin reductase-like flavin-dependent oxidoreductase (luciferase family)
MVAVIGGQTHRFAPLVQYYRHAWEMAGHDPAEAKVGLHSLGYVADSTEQAVADYFPGYREMFTNIGKERGFPPVTRASFDAQNEGPEGALLVGSPAAVAEKIRHHSHALGGLSRVTFQMDVGIPHAKLLASIKLLGEQLMPLVNA